MECDTEGECTFTWDIYPNELITLKNGHSIKSPVVEAVKLKRTRWVLVLQYPTKSYLECYLYRKDSDESEELIMTVTFKLELIDFERRLLESIVVRGVSFSKLSFCRVTDFQTEDFLKFLKNSRQMSTRDTVTIRCHIIEERHQKQVMTWDVPTIIQTQWKIKTTGASNWLEKIKVPFQYTHIDIILSMSASDERINIRIGRVYSVQPYRIKIRVLDDEYREINFKGSKHLFQSSDKEQSFETWIEKSQLVEKSSLTYSFSLICIVSISSGNSPSELGNSSGNIIDESFISKTASGLPLQEDLKAMLLKEKHSDVKLRSHDKIIPAHKCLLSVRSPVFADMFDQDMLETKTGIVDIPDVANETLQAFLEFLYTDTITNTDCEEVLKLMLVADKYQVDVLKEQCAILLMSKLSLENIYEIVTVSEMVNQPNLKLGAINFIKENKKRIISSPVWSDWVEKNMNLAVEILSKLIID